MLKNIWLRFNFWQLGVWILSAGFIFAGLQHFINPQFYVAMMPPYLPFHGPLIYLSGAAEIALGFLLVIRKTRSLAAWGLILLLIAIFPANLYMFQTDGAGYDNVPKWVLLLRLPLQLLLILWVYIYTKPRAAVVIALLLCVLPGCTKKPMKPELWIYTSLYKDTVSDVQPRLAALFPDHTVQFFQAGSEEVAAKVSAEELAGGTKADLVVFSDRFWFEEMAQAGRFHKYLPKGVDQVTEVMKNKDGFYSAVSIPVMVMIYNSDAVKPEDAPKTFKEMTEPKWKNKFCTGSPLSSGTNFTTVAFLQKAYGWDYFKKLHANGVISEGGNSSVIRRVQTKERPVGWVLLENVLRLKADSKIKVIYPDDGVVLQSNSLAIIKKAVSREAAEKVADWFFSDDGQAAMTRSFMYAAVPRIEAPKGAPPFSELSLKAQKWSPELVQELMKNREAIKEEFTNIMF